MNRKAPKTDYRMMTLADLDYLLTLRGNHRTSLSNKVRQLNRKWNQKLTLNTGCQVCRYHKHVELAHIQPIASYHPSALLTEVNHPDNLLVLCPNCHWEFDNGLLLIENIPTRQEKLRMD